MNAIKALFLCGLLPCLALATPPNQAVLDGLPIEYDAQDLRGSFVGASEWGNDGVITNLFVTWDAQYLYIALQGWENNNKLTVQLDVDPGNGTGATTTTNWSRVTPDIIQYNDVGWKAFTDSGPTAFGLDYLISSEGFYNNFLRVLYNGEQAPDSNTVVALFNEGNGAVPKGSPVDMAVNADGTACTLKGFEARIPWTELYNTNLNRFGTVEEGEIVPRGATLRLFANLHNNDPAIAFSSRDAIPVQTSPNAHYTNGLLTTDTYVDVPVDQDNDGFPDLAEGDVNAPYIRYVSGLAEKRTVYAQFNEPLVADTATDTANWLVGASTPLSIQMPATNAVLIELPGDLPAADTLVPVTSSGVEDNNTNSKVSTFCLFPSASGLETSVTVRFVLEKNSGLGASPGASNVFINGSVVPLEWGYPPATNTPLKLLSGSLYYADITFPPTTPQTIYYKYSGQLSSGGGRGTNNFEAIRLTDFAEASRPLVLPLDGSSLVVTDYLGAAAHPWRDPNNTNLSPSAHAQLFGDARRGDAGVRDRHTMLFQLDLSGRDTRSITRVLVQGSDPLRGFNSNGGNPAIADYAALGGIGWQVGGITLYDDGTHGDLVSGDKIYSRLWGFSVNGQDSEIEGGYPYSLVGGSYGTLPYDGDSYWADRRSPRSFIYKYYVVRGDSEALESPAANIERYLSGSATQTVLEPFVWDNESLPLPPPSNSPTMDTVVFAAGTATVVFENDPNEKQHGVQISTNLLSPWLDYGQRAVTNLTGEWTAVIPGATPSESYRAFAGPASPDTQVRWEPNPVPSNGGTLRIIFDQNSRALAGDRNVQIAGTFSGWGPVPMTFMGDGLWYYDATIASNAADTIEFKPRNLSGSIWLGYNNGNDNYLAYKGTLRATWTPSVATNNELLTILYDATGGPLLAATNINAHVGYNENWQNTSDFAMTNTGGTLWETAFPVSTSTYYSISMVFNGNTNAQTTVWDNETSGRHWRLFIAQP